MNRIKKFIIKRFKGRKAGGKNKITNEKSKSRDFENPHRFVAPKAIQIFSEYTPGLGRRIPEVNQDGAFFEVKYAYNYERRVDWLYSPYIVPTYHSCKKHSGLDSDFPGQERNHRNSRVEIFTFDEKDISFKRSLSAVKESQSPLH